MSQTTIPRDADEYQFAMTTSSTKRRHSHAKQRAKQRNISPEAIKHIIETGEPTGEGYNGCTELRGTYGDRTLNVVIDPDSQEIVTIAEPGR